MAGGAGGTILGMIISYRENMRLRKKSIFNNKKTFEVTKPTRFDSLHQKIAIENLSDEQRNKIKERTLKANQRSRRRVLMIFVPFIIVLSLTTYFILSSMTSGLVKKSKIRQNEIFEKKKEYYDFCIDNGDGWSRRQKWDKAIDHYQNAIYMFPDDYTAKLKLASAYLNNCLSNNRNCFNAKDLLDELISAYPNEKDLYELRVKYYLFAGEVELANKDFEKIDELKNKRNVP